MELLAASAQSLEIYSLLPYGGVLSAKAKVVGDHGDELRVGGLALYIADGIAEELGCV